MVHKGHFEEYADAERHVGDVVGFDLEGVQVNRPNTFRFSEVFRSCCEGGLRQLTAVAELDETSLASQRF